MEWISVEDRLPEKLGNVYFSRDVLFIDKNGVIYCGYLVRLSNNILRWTANCGCSGGDFDKEINVTHWRELPDKPEEIHFDTWTRVDTEDLIKQGKTQWVYRSSNYSGPLAIDGLIKKEINDIPGTPIILTKDEARIIWPERPHDCKKQGHVHGEYPHCDVCGEYDHSFKPKPPPS